MKKTSCFAQTPPITFAIPVKRPAFRHNFIWTTVLILVLSISSVIVTKAQEIKYSPLKVSSVEAQPSNEGTTVSILAERSLQRAQTWQDNDGYHITIPYATAPNSLKLPKGVKIRRLGQLLEILLQVRSGTSVSVHFDDNRMTLLVDGNLESRDESAVDSSKVITDPNSWQSVAQTAPAADGSKKDEPFVSQFPNQATPESPAAPQTRPDLRVSQSQGPEPVAPPSEIQLQPEPESFLTKVFSVKGVLIIFVLGAVGLFVSREIRARRWLNKLKARRRPQETWVESEQEIASVQVTQRRATDKKEPPSHTQPIPASNRTSGSHIPVAMPDSLYGAYRIDQEVGKLILGQPHRTDVLSSRAPDDRRAIEAALIRMMASCVAEDERRRAYEALEEYGFVARECAVLLMSTDPFDRTNAARVLAEIKSPGTLPFLQEALYDPEPIVRNQVVVTLGELKMPRAIGALLDMARRHPDVPGNLVSQALSACSVEGLDFFDTTFADPEEADESRWQSFDFDVTQLEPALAVEDLPASSDDEAFEQALSGIKSENLTERLEAAKTLARFGVVESVAALTAVARTDSEATVRSQAISSLGVINHESVFPAVLIGMADDSREVRASAARSLTHLSFDRTAAYLRVLQTDDEELRKEVAQACIKTGIILQGIDRLTSGDRRQAYETFSIVSLLARTKMTESVVEAIANHPNLDIRLALVKLLTSTGERHVFDQLRELAVQDGLPEELRTALLEAIYELDQSNVPTDPNEHAPAGPGEITNETVES